MGWPGGCLLGFGSALSSCSQLPSEGVYRSSSEVYGGAKMVSGVIMLATIVAITFDSPVGNVVIYSGVSPRLKLKYLHTKRTAICSQNGGEAQSRTKCKQTVTRQTTRPFLYFRFAHQICSPGIRQFLVEFAKSILNCLT